MKDLTFSLWSLNCSRHGLSVTLTNSLQSLHANALDWAGGPKCSVLCHIWLNAACRGKQWIFMEAPQLREKSRGTEITAAPSCVLPLPTAFETSTTILSRGVGGTAFHRYSCAQQTLPQRHGNSPGPFAYRNTCGRCCLLLQKAEIR